MAWESTYPYVARAYDGRGSGITVSGIDPEALYAECHDWVIRYLRDLAERKKKQ
jgi:hypothetical protein